MYVVRAPVAILLVCSVSHAEVLHEKVNVGALKCAGGVCTTQAGTPVAVDHNGELIYPPRDGVQPKPGEPVYGPQPERVEAGGGSSTAAPGDPPPERRDVIHPDRDTGPEGPGKHYYHEVFNPSVFPFKRMTVLDGVTLGPCGGNPNCEEEQLVVRDRGLVIVPVGGRRSRDRDAFWGSIVVDLEPRRWLPIPTPGAGAGVLSYETQPAVELQFARDSADNLYVQSPTGGRHRLTYLVDAPQSYFGGEVPLARIADEPAELVPSVPAVTRERVRSFLSRAHIDGNKNLPLSRVLDPLVAWFRAFEVGELPVGSGNTYLDLACSQKGCCRHRSYAFAITAMAMGIPARYVENELHVFVEVYLPRVGWRRINLGGALLDEEVLNADDKTPYQPRGGDPFPQPPEFTKNAQPPGPHEPAGASASANGSANANANANGSANGRSSDGSGAGGAGGSGGMSGGRRVSHEPGLPYVDLDSLDRVTMSLPTPSRRRLATGISLSPLDHDAFRGESVDVAGTVRADGGNAAGLPVEIYLQGPGGALRVGGATTDGDGRFHASFDVPRNLPLGDHRVVARTPGDDTRAASRTR